MPSGFEISSVKPHKLYSRLAGTKIDLEDELFSEENGNKGFWEPVSFYKEIGGNIYFLEEYDPQKIPILFIHGATGTPKDWKYFVDNIDRKRFQPWLFYYPSGARIKSMSNLLSWKLGNLQIKYHFDQLYITAHSMGGLVARSLIMDYGSSIPYINLFVSLATPWGGVRMAEHGVKQSPAVIPSWIDMQPESAFIQSIYRTNMPETVNFYMFYGHRGNRNPFRSNNDGTIALSSLLDSRPQAEAEMNYAFNEDHASIIYSKAVLDQYNAIINTFSKESGVSSQLSGGYLKIHFSYNFPFEGIRPRPTLVLQPIGKNQTETAVSLNVNDNGRILGPFPAGDYLASFGALTAISGKRYVSVKIENNETSELQYVLTPDNIISGYISTDLKPKDRSAGMPNENVLIQSITLKGAGILRKPLLLEDEDDITYDYYILRTDHYFKGNFVFFGLPPGEYELDISAHGYKSFAQKCFVKTGKQTGHMFIVLTPEQ
jgi:pimeloyl-ACP methyl ester carboxylesterase